MKLLRRHPAYQRRFWLQLWTHNKFSEPRVSLDDSSKEVENGESWTVFAARSASCRHSCVPCVMCRVLCRNLLRYFPVHRRGVWTQVLDAFSTEIPVYLENGTRYPVNIKHPIARFSQHQLSLLFECVCCAVN